MPSFSLIIPIYNVSAFLPECIDSVLAQSYTDWEIIGVDDGSTDNSGAILDQYAEQNPRIQAIHQKNGGLSAARNTGIAAAQGEYLLFLDSDDVLTPNALDVLHERIAATRAEVLAFNAELWYYEQNRFAPHYYSRYQAAVHPSGLDYLCAFTRRHHWGPAAACFYCVKRSVITAHNWLFEPGLLHEDELWVPMMLLYTSGSVAEIAQTFYWYRMRSGSITHVGGEKACHDILSIAEKLERTFAEMSVPKDVAHYIVCNNAKLGLMGLRRLGLPRPLPDRLRLWRNANWKQKIKHWKLWI